MHVPILSSQTETQPILTLRHHGIWWCVYISRSLPISSLLLPVQIYSYSILGLGDACLTTTGRKARWQLILDWSKFVESILVGPKGKHFYGGKAKWNERCSVVSDSLRPYGLWNSPGQNTGAGSLPFSRGSSQSRDWTQVSHTSGGFFTSWATREAQWWW